MEEYILISHLNDFVFCPISIYYHQLYGGLSTRIYQDLPQIDGKFAHESIDENKYSTRKNILQGLEIYSEQYKLCGKIDVFDIDKGLLTERKKHISQIYDGYIFQLYAQYFCLTEMGFKVNKIRLYSSDTNKNFDIKVPTEDSEMFGKFESTISEMQSFDISSYNPKNKEKCQRCIYKNLCDRALI